MNQNRTAPDASNDTEIPELLTNTQVAEMLAVSVSTVQRWQDDGLVEYLYFVDRKKDKGTRRMKKSTVVKMIQDATIPARI